MRPTIVSACHIASCRGLRLDRARARLQGTVRHVVSSQPCSSTRAEAGGGSVALQADHAISDPSKFDPALRGVRHDLAAAYRCLFGLGINTFTYNHCTVDCGNGRFLVNRYGLSWGEVTPENLLLVDSNGNLLEGEGPVMTAAFMIHRAIHQVHGATARVVFHTHQTAASALGCVELPGDADTLFPHVSEVCKQFLGRCAFDPVYEGVAVTPDEGFRIAAAMKDKPILFMAHHGVTLAAQTVAEAVHGITMLEVASNEALDHDSASLHADRLRLSEEEKRLPPIEFFAALRARNENEAPGTGERLRAWDGRGPFAPAGYGANAPSTSKMRVDLAAVQRAMARLGLVGAAGGAGGPASLSMSLGQGKLLVSPSGGSWSSARAAELVEKDEVSCSELSLLHSLRGEVKGRVLLAIPAPRAASALAGRGLELLPFVQDAMLMFAHVAMLPASASFLAESSKDVERALASSPNARIVVGQSLLVAFGNSPGHVLALVERYEKACALQLKSLATGRKLRLIADRIIKQPINGFLCDNSDDMPAEPQKQLETYKRAMVAEGCSFD